MNTLSANLIKERESRNLKQKDVAAQIGVVTNTYGKYERGERQPDLETIIKIANLYQMSLDILTGRYK